MLAQFLSFINSKDLFHPKEKILLAVSGGVDSVVMAELFHLAGFKFGIAHCNFQLRGKESVGDEKFTSAMAKKYKVKFYSEQFLTSSYAKVNKLSLQEAARNIRYEWLQKICEEHNYFFIATAHHLNDSIETFLINTLRGTGISGLSGINPATEEGVVRPMLFASRKEIEHFAKKKKLKFREDSSNKTDDYLRNRIRHQLVPVFRKLNPAFEKTMAQNLHNLSFTEHVFNQAIIEEVIRLTHHVKGTPYFSRKELEQYDSPEDYLFEFISPFGFNASQVKEIWACRGSGKVFYAGNFRIICDRDKILFALQLKEDSRVHLITSDQKTFSFKNFTLRLRCISPGRDKPVKIPSDSSVSFLDMDALEFPLRIRKWKAGDAFYPLGMKHRKKVSDFLIDNKFSLPEKENTFVILSEDKIICIPGHRIDDRYKVTARTKKVLRIDYLSNLK